jgi:hypothetical protein
MKKLWIFLAIFVYLVFFLVYLFYNPYINEKEGMTDNLDDYIQSFNQKENRIFPFRYFTDENGKILPIVAVTAFFRDKKAEDLYTEYLEKGIHIFGITAYKSFPNRTLLDNSEGEYEKNNTFDYTGKIKNWACCFKNKENYGFTSWNNIIDISESDFYTASDKNIPKENKKYDFIYICNKDADHCPVDGWNAINRNFDLAKKCFPIMCREFKLKGLVVGRNGCGLEKEYNSDQMEVTGWLDWHVLQDKINECKFLFVPNIMDASPRVIAECITKDLQVLMNQNILCGSKYVNDETGEFFTDEKDIRSALSKLLKKQEKVSPKKWWANHYSQEISQKKLRDFLAECFPNNLNGINRVKFIL